ncbi:MAG: hypothetical protein AAB065_02895, partial [Deltaproteobacteria bacterium]
FGLMFGFAVGRSFMNIAASAIASLPARAEAPLSLCLDACESGWFPPDGILYLDPGTGGQGGGQGGGPPGPTIGDDQIIAWTVFESTAAVSTPKILDIICEKKSVAACGKEVTTTMGIDQPAIRTLRCAFKDPTYDTVNKTYDINGRVASWTVIVPIVRSINPGTSNCPPSKQGAPNEPYEIVQYAEITIIEIYPGSAGAGSLCSSLNCPDYVPLPSGGPDNAIKISAIRCVTCPEATMELLGRTPVLVR